MANPGGLGAITTNKHYYGKMNWKIFFIPVESVTAGKVREHIKNNTSGTYQLLDVRQPGEYSVGHLAGAGLFQAHLCLLRHRRPQPGRGSISLRSEVFSCFQHERRHKGLEGQTGSLA